MWIGELAPGASRLFGGMNLQSPMRGWDRISWGQSYDSVKTSYAQAEASGADNLVLRPEGAVQLGYAVSMSFGHKTRQLESVTLSFEGGREVQDFATLSQAITNRLGNPVSSDETSTTWRRDDSTVTLSMSPGGGVVLSETA